MAIDRIALENVLQAAFRERASVHLQRLPHVRASEVVAYPKIRAERGAVTVSDNVIEDSVDVGHAVLDVVEQAIEKAEHATIARMLAGMSQADVLDLLKGWLTGLGPDSEHQVAEWLARELMTVAQATR